MRKNYIDITRGLGIIFVTIGHILGKELETTVGFNHISFIGVVFKFIYSFHMPLFFMLSGLLSSGMIKKPMGVALKNKTIRLMVPYFVWTFIFVLIKNITPQMQTNITSWNVFLLSPIDPNQLQYWYLYVLYIMCLVHFLLYRFIKNEKIVCNILLIISFCMIIINPFIKNIWISDYFFKNFLYYVIGVWLIRNNFFETYNKFKYILCSGIVFLITEILYFSFAYKDLIIKHYLIILTSISGSVFLTLCFAGLDRKKSYSLDFLKYNGIKSMEIYCVHPIIAAACRTFILIVGVSQTFSLSLIIILTIIICNIISLIFKNNMVYQALFGVFRKADTIL